MPDHSERRAGPPMLPFVDLQAQRRRLGTRIDEAMRRVCEHGQFILGPEVGELERRLAEYCGTRHAITCANGTDALRLVLMAKDIGAGDAVFCPSFTFAATAEAVALAQATPVLVDVLEDTFSIDAESLAAAIGVARAAKLRPKAVIAVDLFGLPADYEAIKSIAAEHGLWVIADAAQSFGARYRDCMVGRLGDVATTSFFPAKPLGCYGDGGAVFTDDDEVAERIRSLRFHGKGTHKYDNVRIGLNSRLDTLQAAVLLEKLAIFPGEVASRDAAAKRYGAGLGDIVRTPRIPNEASSVWAQYTIRVTGVDRDRLAGHLKSLGVPTAIYYPLPLHQQTAYKAYPRLDALPVAEKLARDVLSLPIHGYLDEATQVRIIDAIKGAVRGA
jgi:dTDP-4-amino-4,6-dideoxygalactose transaminase